MDEREQKDLIKIIVLLMLRYDVKSVTFGAHELDTIQDKHPDMILLMKGSREGIEITLEDRPTKKSILDIVH